MRKMLETVEEKVTRGPIPMNLQFFAEKETDSKDDSDEGVDEGEDDGDEEGEDSDQTKGSGKTPDKTGSKKSSKTFTQEQVNKMMTREKNQGRNAVLRELGIDPKDSKAIAMVKAIIDSQKTDEEKAAEKESQTQQQLREASEKALKAECKAEAMALGAKREFVDDIVVLVMAKYEEGAEISTLIGEIKTKYKTFFGVDEEEDNSTGKKGTGSSLKNKGKKGEETKGLGSRLAAQRVGTAKKTSNFMKRN